MSTYYVNLVGTNEAPYDTPAKGAPLLSTLEAAVTLQNGDIIEIVSGSYSGELGIATNVDLTIRSYGTNGSDRFTNKPILSRDAGTNPLFQIDGGTVLIENIRAIANTSITVALIDVNTGPADVTITGCDLDCNGNSARGVYLSNEEADVYMANNIVRNSGNDGVYFTGTAYGTNNVEVHSNTFYNCGSWGIRELGNQTNSFIVRNNIIDGNGGVSSAGIFSSVGIDIARNCIHNVSTEYGGIAATEAGAIDSIQTPGSTDPLFVNPAAGDFSLQLSSPCIDSGSIAVGNPTTDYFGISRPEGAEWDRGAIEFVVSDTTPPAWENSTPTIVNQVEDGFGVNVQIDENGTAYSVVVPLGSPAPTPAEVVAGQSSGGGSPTAAGNVALTASSLDTITFSGLAPDVYDVYTVAEDDEPTPNVQATTVKLTVDIAKPNYATGYPKLSNVQGTSSDVLVQTDENGTVWIVAVEDDSAIPSKTQIKAGLDGEGNAAISTDTDSLTADVEQTLSVSGLSADLEYDIYVLVEDAAGNSKDPVRLDINRKAVIKNTRPVDTLTGVNLIDRASRRIKDDSFLSLAARWAELVDGKLQAVTTGVPGKIHKFPMSDATASDYETNDVKVGRIATIETIGARITVNINGYVPGIIKGEKLIVSVEPGEEGKLRSVNGATAGTYECVARCENVNNDVESLTWVLISPEYVVVP